MRWRRSSGRRGNSTISDNHITGNADGVLISDETAESRNNLFMWNIITKNPLEFGIVLASHPRAGITMMNPIPAHFGVNNDTVAENVSGQWRADGCHAQLR